MKDENECYYESHRSGGWHCTTTDDGAVYHTKLVSPSAQESYTREEVNQIAFKAAEHFSSVDNYDDWTMEDFNRWFDENVK